MHFFYLDESGCTGADLTAPEQPIFVLGGIIVRDEGWNRTLEEFNDIIDRFFNGHTPDNFELHTADLMSPSGKGFFDGIDRDRRNGLADSLLDFIAERKHQITCVAIEKIKLAEHPYALPDYIPEQVPYLLAFDYMISQCEWYIKNKLGKSARGLIVLDTKDIYQENIDKIILHHRYGVSKAHRAKWITEFANPVDSQRNPMIQLSDLVCFLTRKFLEIDKGYHDEYPSEVKNIYRNFYKKIHKQRISVKLPYTENISRPFRHQCQITDICCVARKRFATTAY